VSGWYKLRSEGIRELTMTVRTLEGAVLSGGKTSACALISEVQVTECLKIILLAIFSIKGLRKWETPVVCGSSQVADKPTS
jgi:hypothetical protein